ncbi:uncharacterized protein LOC142767450 isoform X3 [Rhipicephalus microplus]|uniref:uncharacterized protein LOC142767450 isoform X3 n=1 Tax=Rhipicephalus microplus TaxID=6941 RepID=UPI003F6D1950
MNVWWCLFLLIAVASSQENASNGVSMDANPPHAPGCGDMNGQSGEKTPPSTSTTKPTAPPSTSTTPSTTTTQATTTTPSTTTTSSTTTTRDARQGGNGRYAVRVNKRGCVRKVLTSHGSEYPASCRVRCPLYDRILPDRMTCLKVIRNQLQERRSVAKLMCWKGYCIDGVCVTTHRSQQCEVPENRTYTRRPNPLAE